MEQAKDLAQQWLGGGQQERPAAGAAGAEAPAGDKQPAADADAGGGWMGAAERFVEGQMRTHAPAQQDEGKGAAAASSGGASGLVGMAQQYIGGTTHTSAGGEAAGKGAGDGGSARALLGAAQSFMGGGGGGGTVGEGGAGAGAAGGTAAGAADPGLVDKLLAVYKATHGKQFGGSEGEYDQLASLAHSALGTPIGRDLLKSWVRQRLGV